MILKHYDFSINISQKPISKKESHTRHKSKEKANNEARNSINKRQAGSHTRRLYRVNIYWKEFL